MQPPRLSVGRAGDWLKLNLAGAAPNSPYILQTTTDLNLWQDFIILTTDSAGLAQLDLHLDSNPGRQFYRVRTGD